MPLPVIFGSLFLAGGLWLVIKAFQARSRRLALLSDCVRVVGKVVRHDDTTTEGDIHSTWSPVVRYTVAGTAHDLALLPMSDTSKHAVGARVPVFYHRADPANAVAVRRSWDVTVALLLSPIPMLIGVLCFVAQYQEVRRLTPTPSPASTPRP